MVDGEKLGRNIVAARENAGLSAAGLGRAVGAPATTVWRWEKRGVVPDAITLKRVADACGVSVDSLLSEQEPPAALAATP